MNRKVSIIIIALILAIVIFVVSTNMQKELINYIPTIDCLVATKDISANTMVSADDFKIMQVPVELIASVRPVQTFEEIKDLYLKSDIYKGQLALYNQFDTAKNLMIFNGEEGKEKIAIKLKSAENATSYILKKGSLVNVYATLSNEYANSPIFEKYDKVSAGSSEYGYTTIKILENVVVIGSFDENGEEVEDMPERIIDTILVSILPEEAYKINLIREIASFNVTEL